MLAGYHRPRRAPPAYAQPAQGHPATPQAARAALYSSAHSTKGPRPPVAHRRLEPSCLNPSASALHPPPPGSCTSAEPARQFTTGRSPAARAEPSCCASTTPTRAVRPRRTPSRSCGPSPGSASTGTRAPAWAATAAPTTRPSAATTTGRPFRSSSTPGAPTPASAPPRSSRPRARPPRSAATRSRAISAPAATSTPRRPRGASMPASPMCGACACPTTTAPSW